MNQGIIAKLEASRKELLDLSLRNPLLNYTLPAKRGVHIVQEKPAAVYDILVTQGKAMTFSPKQQAVDGKFDFAELPPAEQQAAHTDTKLQTDETEALLQTRLLNTYYAARTSMEEQGINILYVALGMLRWFEASSADEERAAPLLLVPVSLERSSVNERFKIRYTLDEIEPNISLQAKIKSDFGITIPGFVEDELKVGEYFEALKAVIKNTPQWRVDEDSIELGFFSFAKLLIYNDLDVRKWPETMRPEQHPLLQSLLEAGFTDKPLSVPDDAFIDRDTNAHELFQVADADSSQILAMLAVRQGGSLVIQGPPGTGKSQTITNIIADAVGMGKKVLFVAEKMAALEVVKRKLGMMGLGEACLELHSNKANKKELNDELKRVLDLGKPKLKQLQHEVAMLETCKGELNDYCNAVNGEIGQSGLTVQKLTGLLLNVYESLKQVQAPKMQPGGMDAWDAETVKRAVAFAERIQALLQKTGVPVNLLFYETKLLSLLPHEQAELAATMQQTKTATVALIDTATAIATHNGLGAPANKQGVEKLIAFCKLVAAKPPLRGLNIENDAWLLRANDVQQLLANGKRAADLHGRYADIFIPEAWQQDVMPIRQNLLAYGDKWYKFLIGSYGQSNKTLATLCKMPLPKGNNIKLEYVNSIMEHRRLTTTLREQEPFARLLFGTAWAGPTSNWDALGYAARYLRDVHEKIASGQVEKAVLEVLKRHEDAAIAKQQVEELTAALAAAEKIEGQLAQKMILQKGAMPPPYTAKAALLQAWVERIDEIQQAIDWNRTVAAATEQGLVFLTDFAVNWPFAKNYLRDVLLKTWYEYLLEKAMQASAALRKFESAGHGELTAQFKRLDVLNLQYNQARVAYKHWEGLPTLQGGGQINILRTEFNKRARFKPIRKLVGEAGLAIQTIKPVFMMSPLSIANFLPPGSVHFDMVIFDEASQVRPVDAIGALLRGKQLVVVGDNKQLPPTNFFDTLTTETDDEDNVTADMQSILGLCDAKGALRRMLRWHYRSLHEDLISFSNNWFYDDKLLVFPSPGSKLRMGLVYHCLKDTVYDRGKTRTNPQEAEAVARAVIAHAATHPALSLGVVAFSTAQRQAIQDALETLRKKSPTTEPFFKSHPHEPFFIKNLENVQGDERDVMFISVGYGRSADGSVAMNFGPLNNEGGERRLNVLVTRAKLRCEVFTNLTAQDIDLNRSNSLGITALKQYLQFAQTGMHAMAGEAANDGDSPFEDNVASKLTHAGYTIRRKAGCVAFYIDIVVVDPTNPGRYILGIECDGAAYHSARSARDRDRLRQEVLEAIGWNMYRIWSTDWFKNPTAEFKKLVEAIEKATQSVAAEDDAAEKEEEEKAAQDQPATIAREEEETLVETPTPAYEIAIPPTEIADKEIYLQPADKIAGWIAAIAQKESPVHVDEVVHRIADASGVARTGNRMKLALTQGLAEAERLGLVNTKHSFVWHAGMHAPVVRNRQNLPAASRKIEYIAPEEMEAALKQVVENAIAIDPEAAVPLVLRMFGFSRTTDEMKKHVLDVIETAVANKAVAMEGKLLKLTETVAQQQQQT